METRLLYAELLLTLLGVFQLIYANYSNRPHWHLQLRTLALVLLRQFIFKKAEDHDDRTRYACLQTAYVAVALTWHLPNSIWDAVPVKTQNYVKSGLLHCLKATLDDQSDEERNNLCKTASYIAEEDSESGCKSRSQSVEMYEARD